MADAVFDDTNSRLLRETFRGYGSAVLSREVVKNLSRTVAGLKRSRYVEGDQTRMTRVLSQVGDGCLTADDFLRPVYRLNGEL